MTEPNAVNCENCKKHKPVYKYNEHFFLCKKCYNIQKEIDEYERG